MADQTPTRPRAVSFTTRPPPLFSHEPVSMAQEQPIAVSIEKGFPGDETVSYRNSSESQKGLLRSTTMNTIGTAQSTMDSNRVPASAAPEAYYSMTPAEPIADPYVPQRRPSQTARQLTRYAPPLIEYAYDEDRGAYQSRGPPGDYYTENLYYNRPYRRARAFSKVNPVARSSSVACFARGPPGPPRRPRRPAAWEDASNFDEEEEYDDDETTQPRVSMRPKSGAGGGGGGISAPRSPSLEDMRIPFTTWMNHKLKNHFVATLGEFVGTTMFLFFAFAGTQVANLASANPDQTTTNQSTGFSPIVLLYIGIAFGFSLMVNVWIFFRISGGLFNPAVTLAMMMTKTINYARATLLVMAQIAGSIFASWIVSVLFPTPFNVRTTLSGDTSLVRGVFIEAILTAELIFTIFMLAKEKHRATFMAPIGIGLSLFVAELVGVYYTGGSLNPARSFGPCVVTGYFDREHWIYWVGPALGAFIAVAFYRVIKVLEYEMANPGQDETSDEAAAAEADAATPTPKKETV